MSTRDRRTTQRVAVYRAQISDSDEIWEVEYESISDALHFACRDLREGRRTPLSISEDGVLIYDAEAIARFCSETSSALDPATADGDGGE